MHGQNILKKIKSKNDFEEMLREVTFSKVENKWKGAKYINHFMNFDAMFKYDEEGSILLNLVKDPKEYKKIIFNPW